MRVCALKITEELLCAVHASLLHTHENLCVHAIILFADTAVHAQASCLCVV